MYQLQLQLNTMNLTELIFEHRSARLLGAPLLARSRLIARAK